MNLFDPQRSLVARLVAAGLILAASLPSSRSFAAETSASTDAEATAALQRIADDTWLLRGAFVPGRQPDGNSIVLSGSAGLVVIDTGRHAAHTQRLVDFAQTRGAPVIAVINTHWHLDHVGGNVALRAAYPALRVHATPAIDEAMHGFLARYRGDLERMVASAGDDAAQAAPWRAELALIDAGQALYPDVPLTQDETRTLAGRALQLHVATRAVTAADLWAYDPATRVLFAGDLVTLPAPFLDTACPRRWRDALTTLDRTAFRTLVPGHGPPLDRARFRRYRLAFTGLLDCAGSDVPAGQCTAGWLRTTDDLVPAAAHAFTGRLLDYYVALLRKQGADGLNQNCEPVASD